MLGLNDLVKETRADLSINRRPALYWLSAALTAARAYGLDVLDGVYNNFKDAEGYQRECVHGRRLGFDGKTLIHPDQVAVANEVFAPPEAEVAFARKIIAAFAQPESKGKGVITVEGRMVELLHAEMAARTVAIAEAIEAHEGVMTAAKTNPGNFFEDFSARPSVRSTRRRAPSPRGDVALYTGLYGPRFAVQSSDEFAHGDRLSARARRRSHRVPHRVRQDRAGHLAQRHRQPRLCRVPLPGARLSGRHAERRLRGDRPARELQPRLGRRLRAHHGRNQRGETVLEYVRWVMVRKRDTSAAAPAPVVPKLAERVDPASLGKAVPKLDLAGYDFALAGAPHRWGDYAAGEKIDHADAMTLEEAEHQIATRLYQNTAKVHFNLHEQAQGQFKRRLVYGGVVISLARALSFNGLANAFHIAAINGGRHVAPCFGGDTVYAWSEVLETAEIPGRSDIGALRVRLTAVKNRSCAGFPLRNAKGEYDDGVILDLDLWLVLPR